MLWFSPSKILPVRQWDHQRLEGASCCLNLWIMLSSIKGSIPSHLFMTMTFKAWKLAGVWWTRLLRNPERAVRSFPWQMPYSMKPKPISTEEPLPCLLARVGLGKNPNLQGFPPPSPHNSASGQSWGWFIADTGGAVLFWHSYIVLQHNASPLLKVTVEGGTISFLNLLLYANCRALSICNSIMPMKKNLGEKKRNTLNEFFV